MPVYGYRNLTPAKSAQVLARFDDGAPAVSSGASGNGRVLHLGVVARHVVERSAAASRSSCRSSTSSVRYLAGYSEPQPWLTVGQVLDASIGRAPRGAAAQRVVLTPSGQRVPLEDEGSDVLELAEQGFYELRGDDKQTWRSWRSTSIPAEADLTPMDPKEIVAAAVGGRRAATGRRRAAFR